MREPSLPTMPSPPESIKEVTERIRKAIAKNPNVQLKMPAHLVNRVNAELKRQRAGIAIQLNHANVKPRAAEEARRARNARRNARKKSSAQLGSINRARALEGADKGRRTSPGSSPGRPTVAPVFFDESASAEDVARYGAEQGAPAVGGKRPDALERLTGGTAPR